MSLSELDYKDYGNTLTLSVTNFEELFYYIDIANRFTNEQLDTQDVSYPWQNTNLTLIEFRYGCKRTYDSFYELSMLFLTKTTELIETFVNLPDHERYYSQKRWKNLIYDITLLVELYRHRATL